VREHVRKIERQRELSAIPADAEQQAEAIRDRELATVEAERIKLHVHIVTHLIPKSEAALPTHLRIDTGRALENTARTFITGDQFAAYKAQDTTWRSREYDAGMECGRKLQELNRARAERRELEKDTFLFAE